MTLGEELAKKPVEVTVHAQSEDLVKYVTDLLQTRAEELKISQSWGASRGMGTVTVEVVVVANDTVEVVVVANDLKKFNQGKDVVLNVIVRNEEIDIPSPLAA